MLSSILCLALMIHYESRGEVVSGQLEVGAVAVNRAILQRRSICSVVLRRNQFSPLLPRTERATGLRALEVVKPKQYVVAIIVLLQLYRTENTHFSTLENNVLQEKYNLVGTREIGNHRFFREEGYYARASLHKDGDYLASQ